MSSKMLGNVLLTIVLTLSAIAQEIPAGTVLPVVLDSTLDASKDHPGRRITGRIMQDVPLPDGGVIPARSRVQGSVVSVSASTPGSASRLTVSFDRVVTKNREISVVTRLRALASMAEVFQAKLPTNALDDYGTSTSDWNTVQVGGAGVYRGNGEVVSGDQIVGRSTDYGAVTARLVTAPKSGCRRENDGDGREQALWVFSPWACGLYGFNDLKIVHTGSTYPLGQIELEALRNLRVEGGSGWLLRVESANP